MTVLERDHYGDARNAELGAAEVMQLWPRRDRVITVETTGAAAVVRLGDATAHRWVGAPKHYVFNDSASSDPLLLHDRDGTLLRTIAIGDMVVVALEDNATVAGVWAAAQPVSFSSGGAF
ncbi:MAG: hypothetical protein DRH08_00105 [Deltaproteobacteria bacterium]|nr:MAG: hypothetical protein DRH08_00105 [Deltaproteobacteria bacterium]